MDETVDRVIRVLRSLTIDLALCAGLVALGGVVFSIAGAWATLFALLLGSAGLGAWAHASGRPSSELPVVVFLGTLVAMHELARIYWLDYVGGPPPRSLLLLWESLSRTDLLLAALLASASLAGWHAHPRLNGMSSGTLGRGAVEQRGAPDKVRAGGSPRPLRVTSVFDRPCEVG